MHNIGITPKPASTRAARSAPRPAVSSVTESPVRSAPGSPPRSAAGSTTGSPPKAAAKSGVGSVVGAARRAAAPEAVRQPIASADADSDRNPFLAALGERVRALRARRGMTRKAVALAADVSERHLANLEYGTGNASILILLQVAQALQCSLAEMLGDVTTSSPEWLMLREMLERSDDATLRRVRIAVGELLGTGGANERQGGAQLAGRADRPARRRQVHARPDARRRPGLPVRRTEP